MILAMDIQQSHNEQAEKGKFCCLLSNEVSTNILSFKLNYEKASCEKHSVMQSTFTVIDV
jgi:hypothetical protein